MHSQRIYPFVNETMHLIYYYIFFLKKQNKNLCKLDGQTKTMATKSIEQFKSPV